MAAANVFPFGHMSFDLANVQYQSYSWIEALECQESKTKQMQAEVGMIQKTFLFGKNGHRSSHYEGKNSEVAIFR